MYLSITAVYILYTNPKCLAGEKCHVPGAFSTVKSSDLDCRDGVQARERQQDAATQPQPSSLHCVFRVDEVDRILKLPGSHRGGIQRRW